MSASYGAISSTSGPEASSTRTSTSKSLRSRSSPRSERGSVTRTRTGSAPGEDVLGRGDGGAALDRIAHGLERQLERREAADDVERVVVAEMADPEHLALQRTLSGREDDPVVRAHARDELVSVDALRRPDRGHGPRAFGMLSEEVEAGSADVVLDAARKHLVPLKRRLQPVLEVQLEARAQALHQRDRGREG